MKKSVKDLLQMYDNTLGAEGYPRREIGHTPQSPDESLGHARWMIDHMMNGADPRFESELIIMNWVGMIQGILFAEKKVSLPAIREQAGNLTGPLQALKPVKTLPALKP